MGERSIGAGCYRQQCIQASSPPPPVRVTVWPSPPTPPLLPQGGTTLVRRSRMKSVCGEDAMLKSMEKEESLAIVVCAELTMGCFLELVARGPEAGPSRGRTPYDELVREAAEGGFLLPHLVHERVRRDLQAVAGLLGAHAEYMVLQAMHRFGNALHALCETRELRLKAEQIVRVSLCALGLFGGARPRDSVDQSRSCG